MGAADASTWLAEHAEAVIGLPAEAAAAVLADAGLRTRTIHPGDVVTMEFRPDRIDLLVDSDARVTSANAG